MSRRVLILADLYPPHFAPRVYFMAKRWHEMGWYVELGTEHITEWSQASHGLVFQEIVDCFAVHRIPLREKYNLLESLQELFFFSKSRKFEYEVEKRVDIASFDVLVGFSYRTFPLPSVARLAQKYKKPCIMDCRDIVEQYPRYKFLPVSKDNPSFVYRRLLDVLRRLFIVQRNRALSKATAITTVSTWHCDRLRGYFTNHPIQLFYNGFDGSLFSPRHPKTNLFRIVFTGRILSVEHGDPLAFFKILNLPELFPLLKSGNLEVSWYVDAHSEKILRSLLRHLPESVRQVQRFYTMIPFRQVPDVLANASIVLLLAQPKGAKGIVSTKIFEAMAMEKPILMVQSDRAIRSAILKKAQAGCAVEEQRDAIEFIHKYYAYWKENGYTCARNQNKSYVAEFSRSNIGTKYAMFVEQIIFADRYRVIKNNEATK